MQISRKIVCLLLINITSAGVWTASAGGDAQPKQAKASYLKTIRPAGSQIFRTYEDMVLRADAIFIGRTESDLGSSRGAISFFPNSNQISDFYTMRSVKVEKIIKSNGNIPVKNGQYVNIKEFAVIANQNSVPTRLIMENYEEIMPRNRYIFFVYKTEKGEIILFNGRFSKISLGVAEKDDDAAKMDMKRKALLQFSSKIN